MTNVSHQTEETSAHCNCSAAVERSRADSVQVHCSCIQVSSRESTIVLVIELQCTADFEAKRRLHSASSLSLNVRRTRLSTVGERRSGLPYCCCPYWNSLPQHVTSAHPLCLFSEVASGISVPGVSSHDFTATSVEPVVIFGHLDRFTYLFTSLNTYCWSQQIQSTQQTSYVTSVFSWTPSC